MDPHRAITYARSHQETFVSELKEFLRFPSVSSQPSHAKDLKQCATWLANHLRSIGMKRVQMIPTRGHPIVYAEWKQSNTAPTILIYGHYDVLPGEPIDAWKTPPFVPTVIGDKLHGRGTSDDKGQLFAHIKAIECYLNTERAMPVNVKCLFEGEEEIGSPHLTSFILRNRRALKANAAVISDTRMLGPDRPAISYAQRGGLRAELEIKGPQQELHSGNFGGAIYNPVHALCEIIAGMHDAQGRVAIPGFYDDVRRWSAAERAYMARTGPSDRQILAEAQVESGWGEQGFSQYERTTIRPSMSVNGLTGGHQGPGAKSIIPAKAVAKLSFRLVPDQDPAKIARMLRDYVPRMTPPQLHSSVNTFAAIEPALIDRSHPALQAAAMAYKRGFGALPVFLRSGGSIPVVNTCQKVLGMPAVLMGFGLPGDHIHAPNENFHLPNLHKAIATSIWYLSLAQNLQSVSPMPRRTVSQTASSRRG